MKLMRNKSCVFQYVLCDKSLRYQKLGLFHLRRPSQGAATIACCLPLPQGCARFADLYANSCAPWLLFSYHYNRNVKTCSVKNGQNSPKRAHPRDVLVFLKFGHFSCELNETGSSGGAESEVSIGNLNVKARKTTKHILHKIWRSLKFCKISGKRATPQGTKLSVNIPLRWSALHWQNLP